MGVEALTRTVAGKELAPESEADWLMWVGATDTRNYLLNDPLLDWLDLYGEAHGFKKDSRDSRTDFRTFLFSKAKEFEEVVVAHLAKLSEIVRAKGPPRDLGAAIETFRLMERGVPIIYRAVLRDAEARTYGSPDFLIRSDVLAGMFRGILTDDDARVPARDLGGKAWHYRVLDVKFTTLDLLAGGDLGNSGSAPAYKAQLFIYNQALGRLQGYAPPHAHLLGRGWEQTVNGETRRGHNALERLAPVAQAHMIKRGVPISDVVNAALKWIRRVREAGRGWRALPDPTVPELRPNMSHHEDAPWHDAKRKIASETDELTLLWQVGYDKRIAANAAGVLRWREKNCTASSVGVTGEKQGPILQAILDVNQSNDGPILKPASITAAADQWRNPQPVEFYVDFETVSNLDDDFTKFPEQNGQPLLFMIGCGHVERDAWRFRCFITRELTETEEARIIDDWLAHMAEVRGRLSPQGPEPSVIHWSHAEVSTFETAYNAARARHPGKGWPSPRWFDFLKHVVKAEPVVIRGALGFGLKLVANALHQHGKIETRWDSGPTDGLGAMVGAWSCAREAKEKGVAMTDLGLMKEIERYNEVDCKVMMEVVRHLRGAH